MNRSRVFAQWCLTVMLALSFGVGTVWAADKTAEKKPAAESSTKAGKKDDAKKAGLVDINSATKEERVGLPNRRGWLQTRPRPSITPTAVSSSTPR